MADKKKRVFGYCVVGLVAIVVASLFVSWSNPLDSAVKRLIAEHDLIRLNFAVDSDETGFSANMYAFKPGEEVTISSLEKTLTGTCGGCVADVRGDYITIVDSSNQDDVRLQVEYVIDPGWKKNQELGALITVTRYGPPRRTIWDWIGGLFG